MKSKLLLLTLLCAAATASAEQVYKWTDAAGVVHYSDAPPPKDTQNVQTVRVRGSDRPHAVPMTDAPEADKQPADASAQGAPQGTSGNSADAAEKAKACQAARNNLEVLQSKFPVAVTGGDGKQQALDDKSRQAQIAATNAQIVLYCQ